MCFNECMAICRAKIKLEKKKLPELKISTEFLHGIAFEVSDQYYPRDDKKEFSEKLVKALETNYNTWIDHPRSLVDDKHIPWLPDKMEQIKWQYWNRYRIFLQENDWAEQSVNSIDDTSKTILGFLEDPMREGEWDVRGLVVGHVQAGKTANYTGLICRALDTGFKVIIVLTGIHDSLRCQTQLRIDEGVLGYDSIHNLDFERESMGVGRIEACDFPIDTITTRGQNGDFNKNVAMHFGINPGGHPLMFIIKKNASILRHLYNWVKWASQRHGTSNGKPYIRNVPMLMIDDEADLGSINTKKFDPKSVDNDDYDPTTINRRIRQILLAFQKSAYVGYTATPFANILIHPSHATNKYGDDLFPRNFIVSLPTPSNYMGPVQVFGVNSNPVTGVREVAGLPLVRHVLDSEEWLPSSHKKYHIPRDNDARTLPPSLKKAIMSFMLVIAGRHARGQNKVHNSMLIHVTRFQMVQEEVYSQVYGYLLDLQRRAQYGDGDRRPTLVQEFQEIWEQDFMHTSRRIHNSPITTWGKVMEHILPAVHSIVRPRLINGTSKDILDYIEYPESGLNVIAVGGDKLSRGLTLEGLSVSYFLRTSRMYDTLMQMGRWFGYRSGFSDLCRIFLPPDLTKWFRDITLANEELRQEFDHMAAIGGKPSDYGLKVRSHPTLLVTAPAKMRAGTKLDISFSDSILETVVFHRTREFVENNAKAVQGFIDSLTKITQPVKPDTVSYGSGKIQSWNGLRWDNVPSEEIINFLNDYQTHEDARKMNVKLIEKFIIKMNRNENSYLKNWTVYMAQGNGDQTVNLPKSIGGTFNTVTRAWHPDYTPSEKETPEYYRIRRLVNPTDEGVDLDRAAWDSALKDTINYWKNNPDSRKSEIEPSLPSGWSFREVRRSDRGLLIIYPLEADNQKTEAGLNGSPVFGISFSFPKNEHDEKVRYIVDKIYWDQEYGDME